MVVISLYIMNILIPGMFGKDEFEEAKIGAVCLTMEDMVRMPMDVVFDVENAEEKVPAYVLICMNYLEPIMCFLNMLLYEIYVLCILSHRLPFRRNFSKSCLKS